MSLEQLKCLHDQVPEVLALALAVVDCISLIQVLGLEEIHDRQNLAIVGHQGLTNSVTCLDEPL